MSQIFPDWNARPWLMTKREIRICPGCETTHLRRINSSIKFCGKRGCHTKTIEFKTKLRKWHKENPNVLREKNNPRWVPLEIRTCKRKECKNTFECKVNSNRKYCKSGYKTLIIWEHELKNTPQLIKKLLQFDRATKPKKYKQAYIPYP